MLLKITMVTKTTCLTGVGLRKLSSDSQHTFSAPTTHKLHEIEAPPVVS